MTIRPSRTRPQRRGRSIRIEYRPVKSMVSDDLAGLLYVIRNNHVRDITHNATTTDVNLRSHAMKSIPPASGLVDLSLWCAGLRTRSPDTLTDQQPREARAVAVSMRPANTKTPVRCTGVPKSLRGAITPVIASSDSDVAIPAVRCRPWRDHRTALAITTSTLERPCRAVHGRCIFAGPSPQNAKPDAAWGRAGRATSRREDSC